MLSPHEPPQIDPRFWALVVDGALPHPLILSRDDLRLLPLTIRDVPLVGRDISDEVPRFMVRRWHGAAVFDVLSLALQSDVITHARVESARDEPIVIALSLLRNALIAYDHPEAPLSAADGAPARLIIPGQYAEWMVRWVKRIVLLTAGDLAREPQSHPRIETETLRPTARLLEVQRLNDGRIYLRGDGIAPPDKALAVTVSVDDAGWLATITIGWTWSVVWTPPHAGTFRVCVRALDHRSDAPPREHVTHLHVEDWRIVR